ncbi:hypothetical protein E2C01_074807 [Portunus trituberculatus]|uniref:Uncharacterized protein n=1 Tax=Portunus trituberculatus TaxID=210409 RepID=A0A5B7ID70_PORTR|nr:hypothetical protein [Portunus trituberculatus]
MRTRLVTLDKPSRSSNTPRIQTVLRCVRACYPLLGIHRRRHARRQCCLFGNYRVPGCFTRWGSLAQSGPSPDVNHSLKHCEGRGSRVLITHRSLLPSQSASATL